MDPIMIEALGFAAGMTTLSSSVPQLIANLRNPDLARAQSASRNSLQSVGNGMWLLYGISAGSVSMTTFASLGFAMAAGLTWQTLKVQGRLPHQVFWPLSGKGIAQAIG